MKKKLAAIIFTLVLAVVPVGIATTYEHNTYTNDTNQSNPIKSGLGNGYGIQWQKSWGSDRDEDARYEGPQPIGDCDNDGENELLIGGRDSVLRIFKWNENEQTYEQTNALHCPFYPFISMDADGFAIGDLTGDGENEIAVSWYATIHKWTGWRYRIIGVNPLVEWQEGGTPDCFIGDCDNDGKNEFIISGGPLSESSQAPQLAVFKWNGWRLVTLAEWRDPDGLGYVFMPGVGDVDDDGENEIVLGSYLKVVVLDWNNDEKEFETTIIKRTEGWSGYPFACICKDSDMDGKAEIHVGYNGPKFDVFEWNEGVYELKFSQEWPGEGSLIEGLDVGDVDDDGIAEVCAGTDVVHILQWDGATYVEEAVLPTFGDLAVVAVGDCDNDGKNEIHAGSVDIAGGQEYMSWVFKYGWES